MFPRLAKSRVKAQAYCPKNYNVSRWYGTMFEIEKDENLILLSVDERYENRYYFIPERAIMEGKTPINVLRWKKGHKRNCPTIPKYMVEEWEDIYEIPSVDPETISLYPPYWIWRRSLTDSERQRNSITGARHIEFINASKYHMSV